MALFIVGSAIVAISKTIGLVIGMRVVQAAGYDACLCSAFSLISYFILLARALYLLLALQHSQISMNHIDEGP